MLQHEVMVVDEWHNNGPQDLVTVSLCIQNAINKMHLCSLSIHAPALTIIPVLGRIKLHCLTTICCNLLVVKLHSYFVPHQVFQLLFGSFFVV